MSNEISNTPYTGSNYSFSSVPTGQAAQNLQTLFGADTLTLVPSGGTVSGGAGSDAVVGLEQPAKQMDVEDMILLLTAASSKLNDEKTKSSISQIKGNADKQKQANLDYQQQLAKAQKAMDKSKKAGTFGKVFGWVGAIVGVVVAAAMIATGVGAVAGGLMMASALVGLANQIVTTAAPDWVSKHPAFGYAMMGIQIGLGIASLGAGFAASAASKAIEAGEQVGQVAGMFAKTIPSLTTTAGSEAFNTWQAVKVVSAVIAGVDAVGQGVSTGVEASYSSQAQKSEADSKDTAAEIAKLQAFLQDETKRLKELMDEASEGFRISMNILNGIADSKFKLAQNLKF